MGSRYLLRRLASAFVTILLIVVINFILFRMMPGSPERILGRNPNVTPAVLQATRERWGLDKAVFPDQFLAYVTATAQGDLGFSFVARGRTVVEVLEQHLWPTLILFGLGELIAIVVGLGLGAYSGWKRGGAVDYIGNGVSLILYSTPYFLLGMGMLLLFATTSAGSPRSAWGLLESTSRVRSTSSPISCRISPCRSRPSLSADRPVRHPHAFIRDRDAERGLRHDGTRDGHQGSSSPAPARLPNAMLPAVTLVAINLGYVVAGAITVEVVFNWPGLGTLTVEALAARDYPSCRASSCFSA
jgi:peptide/nickel transport system permease protein